MLVSIQLAIIFIHVYILVKHKETVCYIVTCQTILYFVTCLPSLASFKLLYIQLKGNKGI